MSGRTRVFLDANVLRAPVTRTLILGAEERSEYRAVWSAYAEAEAERNQPPGQAKVSAVRMKLLRELTSAGGDQDAYGHTPEGDRQILADARQAGAVYVITNDVDDFAPEDLRTASLAAVTPDLFLSHWCHHSGYIDALNIMVANYRKPPVTERELHQKLSKLHPQLFEAQNVAFAAEPLSMDHKLPTIQNRGPRCTRCAQLRSALREGLCKACRK